jgi:hypothetical protein
VRKTNLSASTSMLYLHILQPETMRTCKNNEMDKFILYHISIWSYSCYITQYSFKERLWVP